MTSIENIAYKMISPNNASCLLHRCLECMFRAIAKKNIIICENDRNMQILYP